MKSINISGTARKNLGKKESNSLRNEGMVPCVVYGGDAPVHITVKELSFKNVIYSPEVFFVNIDVDGTTYKTVLKDTQFHPVTDRLLHADFLMVHEDKAVEIAIPIIAKGNAPGIMAGGNLVMRRRKVKCKGLPSAFPDAIVIDISKLKLNDNIKIQDLKEDGLEFIAPPTSLVLAIKATRKSMDVDVEEEGEEGAEGETEATAEEAEAPAEA